MRGRYDLSNARLKNANLAEADLQGSVLVSTSFQAANLQGANLKDTDCQGADFLSAYLEKADFQGANLTHARFVGSGVKKADFRNTVGLTDDQKDVLKSRGAIVD